MSWHLAPALEQLRAEVNKKWPGRSKASDGTIGDASHSARTSDHNPNSRGSVNAMDITVSGIDKGTLIAVAKKHPSVRYIISDRKIMNRDIGNFRARTYTGSNPHTKHVHISLYQSSTAENRRQSWGLANAKPVSGVGGSGGGSSYGDANAKHDVGSRVMRKYTSGTDVRWLQKRLYKLGYDLDFDGDFGPKVESSVKAFQKKAGIAVDGEVYTDTIKALKAAKVVRDLPKPKTPKAPKFPLPAGHYFGPKTGPDESHSGYYNHRENLRTWQKRMQKRGWTIKADGLYGPKTEKVTKQFQAEKGLSRDGLIGIDTWDAAWEEPVT